MKPARVLIIAGSDSGGGAGLQADIKTVTMLGGFAMNAVTAVTAQNTRRVDAILAVPPSMVVQQIDAVVEDLGVDAIKIGMIGSPDIAHAVADRLEQMPDVPLVFDPVMIASSGATLADEATIAAFERLMRIADLVTPNAPELTALTGIRVDSLEHLIAGARLLSERFSVPVLAKGGHVEGETVNDFLVDRDGKATRWEDDRIDTRHTHGSGCTLASAIATGFGSGMPLAEAIDRARQFLRAAMRGAPGFGSGDGPMGHGSVRDAFGLNLNQVTVAADDLAASGLFYERLGLRRIVDASPRYARFECPGGATFSIHSNDKADAGTLIYFEVPDLDREVARLKSEGFSFISDPDDKPWLWREALLRDPAGNLICLYRAGENRRYPPWRIE